MTTTINTEIDVTVVAPGQVKWTIGKWFAIVDWDRSSEAAEYNTNEAIKDVLTRDADCGGVFDCSDESVLAQAGLLESTEGDSDDSIESLNVSYQLSCGSVFQN